MRVAVVGGGITGCIAALECAQRGHEVRLFELGDKLGGIMSDLHRGGSHYLNGCHYLDRGTAWFESLRERIDCGFVDFVHEYGSLTSLLGQFHRHDDFAQPVFSGQTPCFPQQAADFVTVGDRLDVYPAEIARTLKDWSRGFGAPDGLHVNCIKSMQLGRLFFVDDIAGMEQRKAESPLADELLGLPRTIRDPDLSKAIASLPPQGFDAFFAAMARLLEASGVEINLSAPVAPLAGSAGGVSFRAKKAVLEADRYLWCTNPTALFIAAGVGQLDSPVTNMFCLAGDLAAVPQPQTVYYHVFSNSNRTTRVFTYDIDGPKVTVEGFNLDQPDADIEADAAAVLDQLGIPGIVGETRIVRQKRYVNYTVKDLQMIEQFETVAGRIGVVPGGWQHFSRDGKIASMLEHISAWGRH
jgi:glycine/D-amino acid oxidase-like deaminating enzyme